MKSRIAGDVVIAYNALSVARENIFLYQKNLLPDSETVARLARRGYELGSTDLAVSILAQQEYQKRCPAILILYLHTRQPAQIWKKQQDRPEILV